MTATVTIDAAGRFVLPKPLRDRLHLRAGSKLNAEIIADKIELTPESDTGVKLVKKGKRLVLATTGLPFDAASAIQAEHEYMATLAGRR